jgi:hypothetical protein
MNQDALGHQKQLVEAGQLCPLAAKGWFKQEERRRRAVRSKTAKMIINNLGGVSNDVSTALRKDRLKSMNDRGLPV